MPQNSNKEMMKPSGLEKELHYIMSSGLRGILVKTMENNIALRKYIEKEISKTSLYY